MSSAEVEGHSAERTANEKREMEALLFMLNGLKPKKVHEIFVLVRHIYLSKTGK